MHSGYYSTCGSHCTSSTVEHRGAPWSTVDCFTSWFVSFFSSGMSAGFLLHSDAAVSSGEGEAALSPVQSLAITGLNMLSLSKPDAAASSRNKR